MNYNAKLAHLKKATECPLLWKQFQRQNGTDFFFPLGSCPTLSAFISQHSRLAVHCLFRTTLCLGWFTAMSWRLGSCPPAACRVWAFLLQLWAKTPVIEDRGPVMRSVFFFVPGDRQVQFVPGAVKPLPFQQGHRSFYSVCIVCCYSVYLPLAQRPNGSCRPEHHTEVDGCVWVSGKKACKHHGDDTASEKKTCRSYP